MSHPRSSHRPQAAFRSDARLDGTRAGQGGWGALPLRPLNAGGHLSPISVPLAGWSESHIDRGDDMTQDEDFLEVIAAEVAQDPQNAALRVIETAGRMPA